MIYLCTALPFEAQPFIKSFQLKRNSSFTRFSVYNNDDMYLIITGTNNINAAIGLTYLLSNVKVSSEDILVNVGVCGSKNKDFSVGSPYLIHKIKDHTTNMTYYPEMLYQHAFFESSIETCSGVITAKDINTITEPLIDMEASSIYQAATYFIKPHQIIFFKIISDHLEDIKLSKEDIENLISPYVNPLIEWVKTISSTILISNNTFSAEEIQLYEGLIKDLRLSMTMQAQLKQLLMYAKSCKKPISAIMREFRLNNDISELEVKTEGKRYFELLQSKLI